MKRQSILMDHETLAHHYIHAFIFGIPLIFLSMIWITSTKHTRIIHGKCWPILASVDPLEWILSSIPQQVPETCFSVVRWSRLWRKTTSGPLYSVQRGSLHACHKSLKLVVVKSRDLLSLRFHRLLSMVYLWLHLLRYSL